MISPTDDPKVTPDPPAVPPREPVQRWRLVLARAASGGDQAQREQQAAWEAALLDSALPVVGRDLPRPRPRFSFGAPLSATIPGEAELLDLFLAERVPAWRVREALADVLPPGTSLVEAYDVWLGEPALPGRVVASVYRARFEITQVAPERLAKAAAALLDAPSLVRERRKGETSVAYDLRPFIAALDVARDEESVLLRMALRHDPERGVGRPDEVLAALSEQLGEGIEPDQLVRERLELDSAQRPPKAKSRQPTASTSRPRK